MRRVFVLGAMPLEGPPSEASRGCPPLGLTAVPPLLGGWPVVGRRL